MIPVDANLLLHADRPRVAQQGATLYTTDRDFARFPGLDWINPLDTGARSARSVRERGPACRPSRRRRT